MNKTTYFFLCIFVCWVLKTLLIRKFIYLYSPHSTVNPYSQNVTILSKGYHIVLGLLYYPWVIMEQVEYKLYKNLLCVGRKNGIYTLRKVNCIPEDVLKRYDWVLPVEYNICNAVYYTCNICKEKGLEPNIYIKQRLLHHNARHKTCIIATEEPNQDVTVLKRKHSTIEERFAMNNIISSDCSDRDESFQYYNFSETKGDGAAYLVGNTIVGKINMYDSMENDDVTMHLLITKFVKTLSRIQRVEFAYIMEMLHDGYITKDVDEEKMEMSTFSGSGKTSLQTYLPKTDTELGNIYLVGIKSIVNNLPRPTIKLVHNHSYVSIRQCISHFLANGKVAHKISFLKPTTKRYITDSDMAISVARRGFDANEDVDPKDAMIILVLQWSDDFDPNMSINLIEEPYG